ncbi:hypothetical protein FSP39_012247 [Pinctada imbricata]|uniref:Dimethylargininase n=1 Tax=Pinctada imbricata TaxID=66713 RepID=A0AA89BR30_PINIB|nr:hypothetical protein FSP39_012247 [Pinctada imbricata]
MSAFHYNFAVLRRIPKSFVECGCKSDPIHIEKAREEYFQLVETLKKCDLRVIELEEEEDYPDCCFVDDCAVVIGGTALITRPGMKTRQGEVGEIRKILRELKFKIMEILDPDAIIEGGDVLFTGKEIFVGLGEGRRTNEKGASAVASAFPEYNVTPIRIDGPTQLKSLVSMAGRDIIAVGASINATKVMQQIKAVAQFSYRILKLDSDYAANMTYVNGRLIHRTREEIGERSYSTLDEKILYAKHIVSLSEIEKAYGKLTSMVLLLDRVKYPKEIVSNITTQDCIQYSDVSHL